MRRGSLSRHFCSSRRLDTSSGHAPLSLSTVHRNTIRPFSSTLENDRALLLEIGSKLGIGPGDLEQWYNVHKSTIIDHSGREILVKYGNSVASLVSTLLPEHTWETSRFSPEKENKPILFSRVLRKKRKALLEIGEKLGIREGDFEAWYKFGNKDIVKHGGASLLRLHGSSYSGLLATVFPEHHWDLYKFPRIPRRLLSSEKSRRDFLTEIGKKMGIKESDYQAWYKVTTDDIKKFGGTGLLLRYKNSVSNLVRAIYSEHNWETIKFQKKPQSFWDSIDGQRSFLLQLGRKFGIKEGEFDGWYRITFEDVRKHGGISVLERHGYSYSKMLMEVFPEHKWNLSKFENLPRNFWSIPENQKNFVYELGNELGISTDKLSDWYTVTSDDFKRFNGRGLLRQFGGSILEILKSVYPDHPWNPLLFTNLRQTSRRRKAIQDTSKDIDSVVSSSL